MSGALLLVHNLHLHVVQTVGALGSGTRVLTVNKCPVKYTDTQDKDWDEQSAVVIPC